MSKLPLDWKNLTINEVATILNGGTPDTKTAEYWGGDNNWLTPAEMGKRKDPYIAESKRKLTDLGLKNSSARLAPPLSVILSCRAPIGHLAINTNPMGTNQGCKTIVPTTSLFYKYLYYYLLCNIELLNNLGTGTTFKELSASKLKEVKIPLPPLPEQKRIVSILDEAFEAIDAAIANTEKNLKNSKELFESYLNRVFMEKGEGWEERKLSEVCEGKITDGTHQTPRYFNEGYIFLSSKNVTTGKIDWENVKYIDEAQHIALQKRLIPQLNDILLAKNGTTGVAAIVDKNIVFDIYVSLALLRPSTKILPRYLLHFVNSPVAKRQFNKRLKGAGVPNLHLEEIREVRIAYPPDMNNQKRIVEMIDVTVRESQCLEASYSQKATSLKNLKQSILQKAFMGELTSKSLDKLDLSTPSQNLEETRA